ncbi:hypothetical protein [Spirillospora sp. NPDC047279]|uniref:hypothetical protein n=1 Tax=Spirillospora sp. NPDC047279 TaxID=3155478 RepID=UPI0033CF31DC
MRPAEDRADYTTERAQLIVDRGLCLCPAATRHRTGQRRAAMVEPAVESVVHLKNT